MARPPEDVATKLRNRHPFGLYLEAADCIEKLEEGRRRVERLFHAAHRAAIATDTKEAWAEVRGLGIARAALSERDHG